MRTKLLVSILCFALFINIVSAAVNVQLSDQGANIRYKTNSTLLSSGSLNVTIYDASSGGNVIYTELFSSGISNGSWSVMLGENSSNPLPLEFGKVYYKDYVIAGESVNFTNTTGEITNRQLFYSPLGDIAYEDVNQSANITAATFNSTGTVYAAGNVNLTIGHLYATNNTWNVNYSNFSNVYAYVSNSTFITWATAYNGTLAKTDAANTFGNFNQTMNGTTFFLWALLNRIGIGTTSPQNVLNVLGDINATTSIFAQNTKNLSIGYDYATNATYRTLTNNTFVANLSAAAGIYFLGNLSCESITGGSDSDFCLDAGEGGGISWATATNGTLATWSQVVNGTMASWANAVNGTLATWATAYNGTLAKTDAANTFGNFNQTFDTSTLFIDSVSDRIGVGMTSPQTPLDVNGTINAFLVNVNGTSLYTGYLYATNGSQWSNTGNYSNFSTIVYGYAVNSTGGGVNYSNILSNQTFNSTFGYFNVTNQTSSVFIVNDTGAFVNGSIINFNLSNIIYPYAINGSTFALNYSNFSNIYAYENNGTLVTATQLVNGSNILGTNVTYAYSLNDTLWSATANYSNFSTIVYGYAVNSTGGGVNYSNILSNQTFNSTFGYFN
ncbi:hypothetical protein HY448_00470, partial [Candidatus Pacearchaeota archaeon]|nr:hypothetical protein [Candidatus Pacearchaeota archaeon]